MASPEVTDKTSRRWLRYASVVGLCLMAGTGTFFATWLGHVSLASGTFLAPVSLQDPSPHFVALDPIMVSLGPTARPKHLRFAAQLDVSKAHSAEVEQVTPRILDMLNGYLRALEPGEIETPGSLLKIRAQLLRRIQVITGDGRVNDLLITEFLLS